MGQGRAARPWPIVVMAFRRKSFDTAQSTLVGIDLMHMLKKRQLVAEEGNENLTVAELSYSLAA
jgi:hypothetical protein